MSEATLWAARHAPVDVVGTCYGRAEVATRIAPADAARALVASFPAAPPSVVWTSPSSRCRLVAEHVAATLAAELRTDEALHEIDLGAWEGLTWSTIAADHGPAYERWMRDWENVAPPSGERPRDVEARVRRWIADLDPGRAHALIAHAGVVRALRVALDGRSWLSAMQEPVEHLSWSRFALQIKARCAPSKQAY